MISGEAPRSAYGAQLGHPPLRRYPTRFKLQTVLIHARTAFDEGYEVYRDKRIARLEGHTLQALLELTSSEFGTMVRHRQSALGRASLERTIMIHPQANPGRSALHATMCSFLGLTARDLAEIGDFSERFARDLLAGRRPFPPDTQHALVQLLADWESITKAFILDIEDGVRTSYIFRTNEQLRASPIGQVWHARGKAAGGFVGPYRAAIFAAWRAAQSNGVNVELIFASTPEVGD